MIYLAVRDKINTGITRRTDLYVLGYCHGGHLSPQYMGVVPLLQESLQPVGESTSICGGQEGG